MFASRIKAAALAAPLLLAAAPAFASNWTVDLGECPNYTHMLGAEHARAGYTHGAAAVRFTCPASSLVFDDKAPGRADPRHRPAQVALLRERDSQGTWRFHRRMKNGKLEEVSVYQPEGFSDDPHPAAPTAHAVPSRNTAAHRLGVPLGSRGGMY